MVRFLENITHLFDDSSYRSVGDCRRKLKNLDTAQESLREAKNMLKDLGRIIVIKDFRLIFALP